MGERHGRNQNLNPTLHPNPQRPRKPINKRGHDFSLLPTAALSRLGLCVSNQTKVHTLWSKTLRNPQRTGLVAIYVRLLAPKRRK